MIRVNRSGRAIMQVVAPQRIHAEKNKAVVAPMISVEALILFVRLVLLVVEQDLLLGKNVVISQVMKKVTLRLLYNKTS